MTLTEYRAIVNTLKGAQQLAVATVRQETDAYTAAATARADIEIARAFAATVAAGVQKRAHAAIAAIVSRCLAAVFDDPYSFEIAFEHRRNKTEAVPYFVRGGKRLEPRGNVGGGVIDVAAFALRLAAVVLARPAVRRVLILDEPFKWVSAEHRPRVRALIEELQKEMGVQFIIVTHIPELRIGKIIEVS